MSCWECHPELACFICSFKASLYFIVHEKKQCSAPWDSCREVFSFDVFDRTAPDTFRERIYIYIYIYVIFHG